MKGIFIVAVFFGLVSCKKDLRMLNADIVGTWEMEKYSGYPFNQPTLPPGNGKIIVIGENGLFERKQQDTLLYRGSYSLDKKKDCYEDAKKITFSTSDGSGTFSFIEVSEGKLLLSTPNCYTDGGITSFRRLR